MIKNFWFEKFYFFVHYNTSHFLYAFGIYGGDESLTPVITLQFYYPIDWFNAADLNITW